MRLERAVRVVRSEEVGVADEEALLVVVGVDEPAGDTVGPSLRTSPVLRVEHVHAVDLDVNAAAVAGRIVDVGLAEDDEEVALAGVLRVAGHVQVGVHARLEHRDAAELAELGGVSIVVEGAGDQHVEAGVAGLRAAWTRSGRRDGAELGPDEDARPRSMAAAHSPSR